MDMSLRPHFFLFHFVCVCLLAMSKEAAVKRIDRGAVACLECGVSRGNPTGCTP